MSSSTAVPLSPLNMPVRALVADDEEAPRQQLIGALRTAWPELEIVAECANGADAWDAFLEHEPELCFLDIRMPGLTGIDVAQRIGGEVPVVFVTAYGDHALAAFDAGAVDYVLKPVEPERLGQALARARTRVEQLRARSSSSAAGTAAGGPGVPGGSNTGSAPAGWEGLLAQLSAQVRRPAPLDLIQASVGKEVRMIRVEDVVYFESDSRYTRVVYRADGADGDALIRTPLKELITQLDGQRFQQVHRSVIVARAHIASAVRIDEGNMLLKLRGRTDTLPVSRHFQALFKGQ
jgi:DNA-binding LytR/AlgR family response regulator